MLYVKQALSLSSLSLSLSLSVSLSLSLSPHHLHQIKTETGPPAFTQPLRYLLPDIQHESSE